jgi:hypothetical protein
MNDRAAIPRAVGRLARDPGSACPLCLSDTDAPLRRDGLDFRNYIRKRPLGHRHLVAKLEKLQGQWLAFLIVAQHQLADRIKRYSSRLFAKADDPRNSVGGIDRAPAAFQQIEGHKQIAGD